MKNILIAGGITLLLLIGFGIFFYQRQLQSQSTQTSSSNQTTIEKNVIHIGFTIDEDGLDANTKEFQPFVDYLASQLQDQGITAGKLVPAKSFAEMAQLVRQGKVDVYIDSAFPVFVVNELAGAKVLANRWKGGVETYHSIIFVKKDGPIKKLDDLKGKIISFGAPNTTTGYFLPKAELIQQGYKLTLKQSPTDHVAPDEIGYIFAGDKIYDNVTNGVTAAGGENEDEVKAFYKDTFPQYTAISKTTDILRFLVATRSDMSPQLRTKIQTVLVNMDKTPQGQTVLKEFAETARVTPVSSDDVAYGEIK